jgi:hypothetical protein
MARNDDEMINMNRESAIMLTKAGIPVSIESGYESYVPKTRIVLYEAAVAVSYGLSFDETHLNPGIDTFEFKSNLFAKPRKNDSPNKF